MSATEQDAKWGSIIDVELIVEEHTAELEALWQLVAILGVACAALTVLHLAHLIVQHKVLRNVG